MKPELIYFPAVFVAALSSFALGALWYSPLLFGKAWMEENGFTAEMLQAKGGTARIFGLAFLWSLVMAFNLAAFLAADGITASFATLAGFLAGFGWAASGLFMVGLFEYRSTRYMLINGGYVTVALVIMGIVLGLWR
jgi:Protein of unknown function (DUF1761)